MSVLDKLVSGKLIAVIRGATKDNIISTCQVLSDAGIHNIEVTVEAEPAFDALIALKESKLPLCLGAGTVLNNRQAERAIKAGAEFIFTPALNPAVVAVAQQNNCTIIPGVLTPTEIYQAYELAVDAVKIFPIVVMGSRYLKQIKAPLPKMTVFVTGGVDIDNMSEYLLAGADGVGLGSCLVDLKKYGEPQFLDNLYDIASAYVKRLQE